MDFSHLDDNLHWKLINILIRIDYIDILDYIDINILKEALQVRDDEEAVEDLSPMLYTTYWMNPFGTTILEGATSSHNSSGYTKNCLALFPAAHLSVCILFDSELRWSYCWNNFIRNPWAERIVSQRRMSRASKPKPSDTHIDFILFAEDVANAKDGSC